MGAEGRTGILGINQISYPYVIDGCDSDIWESVHTGILVTLVM